MIGRVIRKLQLARFKRMGLQVADDAKFEGMPFFGTEPYLISIGPRTTIAGRVAFITHDGSTRLYRHEAGYEHVFKFGRITIHENCFIGFGSILMPGVTIGPNSIVAAGSVVTRDVPPETVVGGVPAKHLKTLEDVKRDVLAGVPKYDIDAYRRDKRGELLKLYPYPWK